MSLVVNSSRSSVLRQYANFLLENKIAALSSPQGREAAAATLLALAGYQPVDLIKLISADGTETLTNHFIQSLKQLRETEYVAQLPLGSQIVSELNQIKKLIFGFLPEFTQDVTEAVNIVNEVDSLFFNLGSLILKVLLEVRQQRENELQKAMEIALIGSYNWDIQNDIITFTPQLYKIFGLDTDSEISYRTIENLVHPDDHARFSKNIAESMANQQPLDLEYRIIRNGKEERVVWDKGQVSYRDGVPMRMQGTILDVTEKRLTEIEVQYREAQLVEAQAIARIGSFDWDFLNNTSSCTAELYRIFGWPKERELNFRTFEELAHPADLEKVFMSLHNAMANKAAYDCEYRIIRPDKSQRWVWARGKVTFDEGGNGIRLTGTVLDITERKQAEDEINKKNQTIVSAYEELEAAQAQLKAINQELERRVKERTLDLEQSMLEQNKSAEELRFKNAELEKINTDLDNFIYTASHDLKAPISNIEGLIMLLAGMVDQSDPKFSKILTLMNASISRFKTTIKDLTEISKVQKDALEDVASMKFADIVEDVLFDIQGLISSSGVQISSHFEVPSIKFSRKNLRSIFYNLISNAIKYRDERKVPTLQMSSRQQDDYVVVTVADNGLGIPEDKVDKIFSMFKRLHTHVEGSGVGLYIVKRIMDNAGGIIRVESNPGVGSSFYLYFKN